MEALHDLIGTDCLNIILDYKEEFERIEYNHKAIDNCIFEEVDKTLFEEVFDNENYGIKSQELEKRYYLNDITIGEFQEYYLSQEYIQVVTFKLSIMGESDDYFQADIKKIKSDFMKDIKIKYIYKLNTFEVCLFLGIYQEHQLERLYECIAYDVYDYPKPVEVIIQHR